MNFEDDDEPACSRLRRQLLAGKPENPPPQFLFVIISLKTDIIIHMNNLLIQQLKNKDQIPWNLLLLADPSKKNVQKYLGKGKLYIALIENKIIGEYIILKISKDIIELKNIAVDKKYQG